MCYDLQARPPYPPISGGAGEGQDLILTAADGTQFLAYDAAPAQDNGARIIILPDVRGLHPFYKELALRFAETGVRAVAIDYFGRTEGMGSRDESFDYQPHVQQMEYKHVLSDVKAAWQYLDGQGTSGRPTFVVGFCRGGTLGLLLGTEDLNWAGVIVFYAGLARPVTGKGTALEHAKQIHYPVLGLFGGADQGIPPEQVQELEADLKGADVEHEIVSYEGAPHSFFDRKQAEFADASTDAWKRILKFIPAHNK